MSRPGGVQADLPKRPTIPPNSLERYGSVVGSLCWEVVRPQVVLGVLVLGCVVGGADRYYSGGSFPRSVTELPKSALVVPLVWIGLAMSLAIVAITLRAVGTAIDNRFYSAWELGRYVRDRNRGPLLAYQEAYIQGGWLNGHAMYRKVAGENIDPLPVMMVASFPRGKEEDLCKYVREDRYRVPLRRLFYFMCESPHLFEGLAIGAFKPPVVIPPVNGGDLKVYDGCFAEFKAWLLDSDLDVVGAKEAAEAHSEAAAGIAKGCRLPEPQLRELCRTVLPHVIALGEWMQTPLNLLNNLSYTSLFMSAVIFKHFAPRVAEFAILAQWVNAYHQGVIWRIVSVIAAGILMETWSRSLLERMPPPPSQPAGDSGASGGAAVKSAPFDNWMGPSQSRWVDRPVRAASESSDSETDSEDGDWSITSESTCDPGTGAITNTKVSLVNRNPEFDVAGFWEEMEGNWWGRVSTITAPSLTAEFFKQMTLPDVVSDLTITMEETDWSTEEAFQVGVRLRALSLVRVPMRRITVTLGKMENPPAAARFLDGVFGKGPHIANSGVVSSDIEKSLAGKYAQLALLADLQNCIVEQWDNRNLTSDHKRGLEKVFHEGRYLQDPELLTQYVSKFGKLAAMLLLGTKGVTGSGSEDDRFVVKEDNSGLFDPDMFSEFIGSSDGKIHFKVNGELIDILY